VKKVSVRINNFYTISGNKRKHTNNMLPTDNVALTFGHFSSWDHLGGRELAVKNVLFLLIT
jgi:hypothetical protein